MELLLNKELTPVLSAIINVTGEIIYFDRGLITYEPYISMEYDIFNLISKDDILKLSMYNNKTELIKSSLTGYKQCVASVYGNGIGKHILLYFISDETQEIGNTISNILKSSSLYKCKVVNIRKYLSKLCNALTKAGLNIKIGDIINTDAALNVGKVKKLLVFVSTILYEISYNKELTINAYMTDYGIKIGVSADVKNGNFLEGVVDFSNEYPLVSSKALFINSLCNIEGIELTFENKDYMAEIAFTYPQGEIREFEVLAPELYVDDDNIKELFDLIFNNGMEI